MPQKPIFTRYPLLSVPHAFLSNGQIRSSDDRVRRLYRTASAFAEQPRLWEGLFSLACLTTNEPAGEPVAERIRDALRDTNSGAFEGSAADQVCIARAALALFEYTADRAILKRLADWCRYYEVTWETQTEGSPILFQPADLMELLVRFYRASGIKSVLRLCARLRSEAFDWTTALNTFQQHIPLAPADGFYPETVFTRKPAEMDYDQRQLLINHAESLADGFRYALYCGLFSGNGQDLAACRTAWDYLKKHHRAVCGGTTSGPLLSGCGSDKPVSNLAAAAWTEAFAAQLLTEDSTWAADELIRIIFNSLSDCLEKEIPAACQYVNTVRSEDAQPSPAVLARICRAASAACRHAVSLTQDGFNINYLLPGKYALMYRKQPVILQTDRDRASMLCGEPFAATIRFYHPPTETAELSLNRGGRQIPVPERAESGSEGYFIRFREEWSDRDGFTLAQGQRLYTEETHHHGVCFFTRSTLLCAEADADSYAWAACGETRAEDGSFYAVMKKVPKWTLRDGVPEDIPVYPSVRGASSEIQLKPYHETGKRISMFPRTDQACLK